MKMLLCLIVLVFSTSLFAHFPENDFWKYDNLKTRGAVTEAMFSEIIDLGYKYYLPLADANFEKLIINKKWSDPTVNANCSRYNGKVTVNMFGGLARRPEISPEGFALVLCHELGHAYGGTPYIYAYAKMSAEGQADYYGAKECHNKIMNDLGLDDFSNASDFMLRTCGSDNACLLGLMAGQSLGNLLAELRGETYPDYETPDKTIVIKTETSYPKTTQCRMDTYLNGVLKKERPSCWFKN